MNSPNSTASGSEVRFILDVTRALKITLDLRVEIAVRLWPIQVHNIWEYSYQSLRAHRIYQVFRTNLYRPIPELMLLALRARTSNTSNFGIRFERSQSPEITTNVNNRGLLFTWLHRRRGGLWNIRIRKHVYLLIGAPLILFFAYARSLWYFRAFIAMKTAFGVFGCLSIVEPKVFGVSAKTPRAHRVLQWFAAHATRNDIKRRIGLLHVVVHYHYK